MRCVESYDVVLVTVTSAKSRSDGGRAGVGWHFKFGYTS